MRAGRRFMAGRCGFALCAGGASRFSLCGGRKRKCTCRIETWKSCDRAIEERSAAQKGYSRKNGMQGVNPSGAKKTGGDGHCDSAAQWQACGGRNGMKIASRRRLQAAGQRAPWGDAEIKRLAAKNARRKKTPRRTRLKRFGGAASVLRGAEEGPSGQQR